MISLIKPPPRSIIILARTFTLTFFWAKRSCFFFWTSQCLRRKITRELEWNVWIVKRLDQIPSVIGDLTQKSLAQIDCLRWNSLSLKKQAIIWDVIGNRSGYTFVRNSKNGKSQKFKTYVRPRGEPRTNIMYTYFHFHFHFLVEDNRWKGII